MGEYKIKINPRAIRDLDEIYDYIAFEKQAPQNAKGLLDRLKYGILGLSSLPQSHQERIEGKFANKGYRQLIIDNYIVIFRVNEQERIVTVVTVQYQGRNI